MPSSVIALPDELGGSNSYRLRGVPIVLPSAPHEFNRIALSAAHVVADPFASREPSLGPAIDWNGTLHFRRHLLDLGMGIAEAMDTAQRGGGLDWNGALELIRRSLEAAAPQERQRIF